MGQNQVPDKTQLIPHAWERTANGLDRIQVTGGHLYRTQLGAAVAMAFVPDLNLLPVMDVPKITHKGGQR